MSSGSPWGILGIEPTTDPRAIRRAYATVLKRTNPEQDAAGFAALRQAYERALAMVRAAGGSSAPQMQAPAEVAARAEVAVPAEVAAPSGVAAPDAPHATTPPHARHEPAAADVPREPAPPDVPREPTPPALMPLRETLASGAPVRVVVQAEIHEPSPYDPSIAKPSDVEQLRANFVALQRVVAASQKPDIAAVRPLLEACLSSPALEHLGVQLDFELALVGFFWQTRERTEGLLDIVIERWKWRERGRSAAASREIATLVAHADNVRHLEQVRESAPRAYRALTLPPKSVWLWVQILAAGLDSSVREVLDQLRGAMQTLPAALNPQALTWWQRYFGRPHLRPQFIQFTVVATLLATIIAALTGLEDGKALARGAVVGLLVAGGGVAFTALWWALIDWPRFKWKLARRYASPRLRLGWAPASVMVLGFATFLPDAVSTTTVVTLLCLGLISWAILMAPDSEDGLRHQRILSRVGLALYINAPLILWWFVVAMKSSRLVSPPMWIAFFTCLGVYSLGQPLLWGQYMRERRRPMRQLFRVLLGCAALAVLALVLLSPPSDTPSPDESELFVLVGTVAIVVAHRTAAVNLRVRQLTIRQYIFFTAPVVALSHAVETVSSESLVMYGCVLFMAGVAISMGMSLYNEWKDGKAEGVAPPVDLRTGRPRAD